MKIELTPDDIDWLKASAYKPWQKASGHFLKHLLHKVEEVEKLESQSKPCKDDDTEDYCGLMVCEQCGEPAWDGYICHACGLKKT